MMSENRDAARAVERIILYLIIVGIMGYAALYAVRQVNATSNNQDRSARFYQISPLPSSTFTPSPQPTATSTPTVTPTATHTPSPPSQTFSMAPGWQLISSYVSPDQPAMSAIFPPQEERFMLCKNNAGQVYWPAVDIQQLTTWEEDQGYLCYAHSAFSTTITGPEIDHTEKIHLDYGWNMIAYWRAVPLAIEAALDDCSGGILIAKNGQGQVYWPLYNVNQIGQMQPGNGYLLLMDRICKFRYP